MFRGVLRSDGPRGDYLIVLPPAKFQYCEMWEIQAQPNYLPRPLPRAKELRSAGLRWRGAYSILIARGPKLKLHLNKWTSPVATGGLLGT